MCTSVNDVKRKTVMNPEADYYLLHLLQFCMYEECPENKAPSSLLSQYLFLNHENYTLLRLMVFDQYPVFPYGIHPLSQPYDREE
jgi:hypothetical protein